VVSRISEPSTVGFHFELGLGQHDKTIGKYFPTLPHKQLDGFSTAAYTSQPIRPQGQNISISSNLTIHVVMASLQWSKHIDQLVNNRAAAITSNKDPVQLPTSLCLIRQG